MSTFKCLSFCFAPNVSALFCIALSAQDGMEEPLYLALASLSFLTCYGTFSLDETEMMPRIAALSTLAVFEVFSSLPLRLVTQSAQPMKRRALSVLSISPRAPDPGFLLFHYF